MSIVHANNISHPVKVDGIDCIYHLCIALLPILCLLNVPFLDISLGTVLLIVFIPHSILYIYFETEFGLKKASIVFFLLFYVYLILRSDGNITYIIMCIATLINLWGISCGSIKTNTIRKYIETYAVINAILIIIQVLIYYCVHYKLQVLPQALFHKDFQESYVFRVTEGLYRPSALFLEPAHLSQYCCFALISVLFPSSGKVNIKKACLIALGCILSTSGMGIIMTCAILAMYSLWNRSSSSEKVYKMILWIPFMLIGVIALLQIPFFQTAIQRVFSNVDGYNAIRGRTRQWGSAISPMSGSVLWLGYGNSAEYPYYLTGLADSIFKHGIIGIVLEFICFLYLVMRKPEKYIWCCCLVFIVLFCVAHLTGFYSQVFYFGILIADSNASKNAPKTIISLRGIY